MYLPLPRPHSARKFTFWILPGSGGAAKDGFGEGVEGTEVALESQVLRQGRAKGSWDWRSPADPVPQPSSTWPGQIYRTRLPVGGPWWPWPWRGDSGAGRKHSAVFPPASDWRVTAGKGWLYQRLCA